MQRVILCRGSFYPKDHVIQRIMLSKGSSWLEGYGYGRKDFFKEKCFKFRQENLGSCKKCEFQNSGAGYDKVQLHILRDY